VEGEPERDQKTKGVGRYIPPQGQAASFSYTSLLYALIRDGSRIELYADIDWPNPKLKRTIPLESFLLTHWPSWFEYFQPESNRERYLSNSSSWTFAYLQNYELHEVWQNSRNR
jgi:hypothetical protein